MKKSILNILLFVIGTTTFVVNANYNSCPPKKHSKKHFKKCYDPCNKPVDHTNRKMNSCSKKNDCAQKNVRQNKFAESNLWCCKTVKKC